MLNIFTFERERAETGAGAFLLTVLKIVVRASWTPAKCQASMRECVGQMAKTTVDNGDTDIHTHTDKHADVAGFRLCARKSSPSCIGHPAPTRRSIEAEIMAAFATNRACKVMSWLPSEQPNDRATACVSVLRHTACDAITAAATATATPTCASANCKCILSPANVSLAYLYWLLCISVT